MNINRNNYEEFFVLYIDKELNATDRALVEAFIEQNPDLKGELEMLQQTILPIDEPVTFMNKESLFRKESTQTDSAQSNELINELNCEEYFVLYADNELNNKDNALVEEFVYSHPQYQEHFELIQQVKFQPEKNIVFPNKSLLYRSENDHKVVPMFTRMRSWKMAAAAAVLLMISGTVWYTANNRSTDPSEGGLATNDKPAQKNLPPAKQADDKNATNKVPDINNQVNSKTKQLPTTEKVTGADKLKATESSTGDNNAGDNNIAAQNNHKKTDGSIKSKVGAIKNSTNPADQSSEKLYAEASLKKDEKESNILKPSNVKQESNIAKKGGEIKVPVVEDKKLDESMAVVNNQKSTSVEKVAATPSEQSANSVFSNLSNENEEVIEPSSDKKNRNRGFFRKVTRVFDRVTSKEPTENRKGLHIASFAIDLK